MTLDEFSLVLGRLEGFDFEEFAFNSINEPFADPTIIEKMQMVIDADVKIENLFFSSNWLIPKSSKILKFISAIDAAIKKDSIKSISINATASGIDQDSYDRYQAGNTLEDTVARYKQLDFTKAVEKIVELIRGLSTTIPVGSPVVVRIKSYGEDFVPETYDKFWRESLNVSEVNQEWVARHVKTIANHGLTTFGRSAAADVTGTGKCRMNWLDEMLVVGPDSNIGLCCQEGARKVQLGSLKKYSLEEIIQSDPYQKYLAITRGVNQPEPGHLCKTCEWYTLSDT